MRKNRTWITLGGCFFAMVVFVCAQNRKPGLWELTTTQTWQQSPSAAAMPGGTHTTLVCLTQQQIDKYGAIVPQTHGRSCEVTNIVKKGDGMTADMVCTGTMSGKGTLESHLIDNDHAKGKVHFVGSIQAGPKAMPVEWTIQSSSVFKSADCGDVKPIVTPDK
jgi:hypothetical protein